jgi:regulatory protein
LDSKSISSVEVVLQKLEYYCSYQERCHVEVTEKLRSFAISVHDRNTIIVHLIEHNFLNEERFASVFSLSKFHQKKWGKIRIKNELKARKISDYLILKALKEIPIDEYETTFDLLSKKYWETITEKNTLKKRKKFCDYLLRKGWESDWVYEKVKELESE